MMLPLAIAAVSTPVIVLVQGLHNRFLISSSVKLAHEEAKAPLAQPMRRGRMEGRTWIDQDEEEEAPRVAPAGSAILASQVKSPLRPIASLASGFLLLHMLGAAFSENYRHFSSGVDRAVISTAQTLILGQPR